MAATASSKAEMRSITKHTHTVEFGHYQVIDDGPGVIERISHLISSTLGPPYPFFTITGSEGF